MIFPLNIRSSWQLSKNPKDAFFDLENIAFSHLHCNILASEKSSGKNMPVGESNIRGVRKVKNKNLKKPYRAEIWKEGKTKHIGLFKTAEEASKAYKKASEK